MRGRSSHIAARSEALAVTTWGSGGSEGFHGPDGSTCANSVSAGGIDLRQPRSGLHHAPLRSPYPAAQRDIDADAAVFIQHFIRTFKGKLRSVEPLSGSRQFHIQKFHYPASIAVPSIGKPLVAAVGSGWRERPTQASIWNLRTWFSRRSWLQTCPKHSFNPHEAIQLLRHPHGGRLEERPNRSDVQNAASTT